MVLYMLISHIPTKLHPCSVSRVIKLYYQIVLMTNRNMLLIQQSFPLFWHEGIRNKCEENKVLNLQGSLFVSQTSFIFFQC